MNFAQETVWIEMAAGIWLEDGIIDRHSNNILRPPLAHVMHENVRSAHDPTHYSSVMWVTGKLVNHACGAELRLAVVGQLRS